ncbi:hypothetical protein TIFTF001_018193 [Ficus carica]|uniref:Flotillin-like n=1 Tax=Ficus carica TaxID=3494 RepID=A0AA88ADL6_FICCA|nr:hypothetical protein TIFTF001_018193 [Ficus carica]
MYRVAGPPEYLAVTGVGLTDNKASEDGLCMAIAEVHSLWCIPCQLHLPRDGYVSREALVLPPGGLHHWPLRRRQRSPPPFCQAHIPAREELQPCQGNRAGRYRGRDACSCRFHVHGRDFQGHQNFQGASRCRSLKGHGYFSYLGKKIQTEAANQAKIDITEATKKGNIGEKLRQALTAQNAAQIDSETKKITTQRLGEGKEEEIKVNMALKVFREPKQRGAELKTILEKKNAETRTENLRADLLSKATVDSEIKVQEANWELYKHQRAADGDLYGKIKAAEAQKANAEASERTSCGQ